MRLTSCLIVALGALGVFGISVNPARAQQEAAGTPRTAPAKPVPMKVSIVRSAVAGCEPVCAEWIAAQGQIDESTPGAFRRVFARAGARRLPILIDSIGGEVDAALAIGRMIRARGLDIIVTGTVIEPCAATPGECRMREARGIESGRPQARISKCASACAFVLAGGVRRYVGAWTLVGVHEIKAISTLRLVRQHYRLERRTADGAETAPHKKVIKEELLKVETREGPAEERTYARVGRYFADMGIAPAIMPIMRGAPNATIHWLKVGELKSTGLATDFLNGEELLSAMQQSGSPARPPSCSDTNPAAAPCTTGSTGGPPAPAPSKPKRAATVQVPGSDK